MLRDTDNPIRDATKTRPSKDSGYTIVIVMSKTLGFTLLDNRLNIALYSTVNTHVNICFDQNQMKNALGIATYTLIYSAELSDTGINLNLHIRFPQNTQTCQQLNLRCPNLKGTIQATEGLDLIHQLYLYFP